VDAIAQFLSPSTLLAWRRLVRVVAPAPRAMDRDLVAIDAHPLPPPRAHAVAASAPGAASPFATLGGDAAPAT